MKIPRWFIVLVIVIILQATTTFCANSFSTDSIGTPIPARHDILAQLGAPHPALVEAGTGRIIPARQPAASTRVNARAGSRAAASPPGGTVGDEDENRELE